MFFWYMRYNDIGLSVFFYYNIDLRGVDVLKSEDSAKIKQLQQSLKKSFDLLQQYVLFPPDDLNPGMYETTGHWLEIINRDVFNMYLTLAKIQKFSLSRQQADLMVKKAKEYGYTVPDYILEQAKTK